ncbi:hypothetical protein [Chitinophaga sp.]|uniref:M949_RS01915 family surface polysaccharide biosynthesis protein n=1 Tax=Chitinophaga sp. TaxID=1869181 RepID=UPI0031DE9F09
MKRIIITLFALMAGINGHSQAKVLLRPAVDKLFTGAVQQQLGLKYPIRLVYSFSDNNGNYYLPLCESEEGLVDGDSLHYRIQAVNLKYENGQFVKQWELNDFVLNEQDEGSIWFYTKYVKIDDIDGDGLADPMIIYGSTGMNGRSDGRLKILLYYKGKKVAIRHQNSEFDGARVTAVDKDFYELPEKVQRFVKGVMKRMADDGQAIYASGWVMKMSKKMTTLQ